MALRRPTRAEIARRQPIVLTPRDKLILKAMHTHGLLTTAIVERADFPAPPQGRRSRCSQAYLRLDLLWRWRFADRIEPPVCRLLGGRRPYLYALGDRGVPVVQAMLRDGAQPVRRRRLERMVDVFVDHELAIARFWANLVALLRGSRVRRWTWTSERRLRAAKLRVKDPDTNRWLPVLPDACALIRYPTGEVQCCFIEVDM